MILETKRLILRKPKLNDWENLLNGIGDYDISKMLQRVPYPYHKKDALTYISKTIKQWKEKKPSEYNFFIELKSEKKIIGAIGIHRIDYFSGVGSTGSWINKKYWRNGYMTEAKIALNDFAFNQLKLRRLQCGVYSTNKASNATQIKIGYKLEGVKMRCLKNKTSGRIHDENMYGLLREDWKKRRPELVKDMKNKY